MFPDSLKPEGAVNPDRKMVKAKAHYNSHMKGGVKKSSSLRGLKKAAGVPDLPTGVQGPALA